LPVKYFSSRTKSLGEILANLAAVGKQMQGFGKNVTLTTKFIKRQQLNSMSDRLEPAFSVDCEALQKQYNRKLRYSLVVLPRSNFVPAAHV